VASSSSIFVGSALDYLTKLHYNPALPFGRSSWEQTVQLTIIVVLIVGLGILAAFYWMNQRVLTEPRYADLHNSSSHFKIKKRQSLFESFSYLLRSKYLLCIAVIVICYNLVMNLVEVVWKDQIKVLYPNENDYLSYFGSVTFYVGVFSTIAAFFVGKLIAWLGWARTALITPVVMLLTSLGFFGFLFTNGISAESAVIWGYSPLAMAAFFGFLQYAVSKSGKHVVFDATKEMAFIPLDHDVKLKGKAAIDGVGSRLGKSGGAVVHQVLYFSLGALTTSIPYIAAIIFAVIVAWMAAVRVLGVEFAALAHKNRDDAAGITDAAEEEETAKIPLL
jgi:AAA family ATP:ADP antiporter